MSDFPWVGKSIMRYNSPHSTDLSFDADQAIRVLGPAPETDDWSLGEILETGKKGIFPKEFVIKVDPSESSSTAAPTDSEQEDGSSTKPTESLPSPVAEAPKATPMTIPPKPDDIINRTPSPPPQNSPPIKSENSQDPLHISSKKIVDDNTVPIHTNDPVVQPARSLSPPPPPSDISTPTPAAPVTVSPSLEPSHPPVNMAASPAPILASPPPSAVKVGGMSASDAKESIKSGGSLKDRMAMFQQKATPATSGPPPIRTKPAGNWSWKNKPAVSSSSTAEQSMTSLKVESATSSLGADEAHPPTTLPASQPGGMSASDAKESITKGGSLKERMAALQGKIGGAAPIPPPVPSGKPRVWKRPEAPSAPVSELVQPEEKKKSKWVVEEVSRDELDGSVLKSGEDLLKSNEGLEENTEAGTSATIDKSSGDKEVVPELTEAEQAEPAAVDDEEVVEKERRAAIAARMAKLGGRGMFAPPPPPPTPIIRKQNINDSTTTEEASIASEPSSSTLTTLSTQAEDNSSATPATAPLPAMPRRAAPPRRKPNATPKASDPIPSAPNPQEIPYPKTDEEKAEIAEKEALAKGEHGVEGAERAGIALEAPEEGEQMDDQPLVSSEAETKKDLPGSTATQPRSTNLEVHPSAVNSASSIDHTQENPVVVESDGHSVHSHTNTTHVDVASPKRKLSIPLPERESFVKLDEAEFRQTIKTPSSIGFVGNEEHIQGSALSGEVSRSPEQDIEKEEANSEAPAEELSEDEEENLEDPSPPLPPPRSTILPPLPPKNIDLSEEEEGAQTEEEGLGHSETEDEPVSATLPPPRRRSMLPPLPTSAPVLSEETDIDASTSAEEEADAEVEEGEEDESEIEQEAPPLPPARIPLPHTAHGNVPSSAASSGSTAPSSFRQRPAVPLPSVPVPSSDEKITANPGSLPPVRSPILSKEPVSALSPPPAPAPVRAEVEAIDVDNTQEVTSQSTEADADSEAARRQSIAARMAKLGGPNQFRLFGGPPVAIRKPVATAEGNEDDDTTREEGSTAENATSTVNEEEEEEDDEVRRARARAKMAAMGGMRMGGFGMAQPASAPPPPPIEVPVEHERSSKESAPTAQERSTDRSQQREETEAYEPEETGPIDGFEESQDHLAPVVNEASLAPPLPLAGGDYQFDVPSFETESSTPPLTLTSPDSEEAPPPPPSGRPSRGLHPLVTESLSGKLHPETTAELPVSPSSIASPSSPITPNRRSSLKRISGVFNTRKSSDGGRPILEALEPPSADSSHSPQTTSQTIDERHELPLPPSSVASTPSPAVRDNTSLSQHHVHLSNVELIQLSRTNGAEVLKIANASLHQSKKSVIADGTSLGFVRETLHAAHCQPPTEDGMSFGHLIFHQTGKSVQARRDDIRPGDIVLIEHAHFRGKKGLTHYTTDVEFENGVVLEFEAKKSKVKVAQAVGKANAYPTLDAASYKLEDLQSGSAKFFRPFK
ncbi:Src homology-3 domain [Phaffia rhodozyma]|uniref:Src homology-3 domain n=1 Tax=Phaffia rhodozyma TaxID=264483 RepID=A0A0F7SKJ0_PHARH|nr:Src homology-3 domain [Phaffia rhodozyma]